MCVKNMVIKIGSRKLGTKRWIKKSCGFFFFFYKMVKENVRKLCKNIWQKHLVKKIRHTKIFSEKLVKKVNLKSVIKKIVNR